MASSLGSIGTLINQTVPIITAVAAGLAVWFWVLRAVSLHDLEAPPDRGRPDVP